MNSKFLKIAIERAQNEYDTTTKTLLQCIDDTIKGSIETYWNLTGDESVEEFDATIFLNTHDYLFDYSEKELQEFLEGVDDSEND